MDKLLLYRKRIIPEECILLNNDTILEYSSDRLITGWHALKPKKDLHHGCSCYFFGECFKLSKFYRQDGSLLYWYCDIIEAEYRQESNELFVTDLLADVIIYPDGTVKVVDLDELVTALEVGSLTLDRLKKAILSLNGLLNLIYTDNLSAYQNILNEAELRYQLS